VPKTPLISIVDDVAETTPMGSWISRFGRCEPNLAPPDGVRRRGSKVILVIAAVALSLVGSGCGPQTRAGGAAGLQGGNLERGATGAGGQDSLGAGSSAAASCNPASAWSSSVETGLPPPPGSDPLFCPK
jgi:hypothetical protein